MRRRQVGICIETLPGESWGRKKTPCLIKISEHEVIALKSEADGARTRNLSRDRAAL